MMGEFAELSAIKRFKMVCINSIKTDKIRIFALIVLIAFFALSLCGASYAHNGENTEIVIVDCGESEVQTVIDAFLMLDGKNEIIYTYKSIMNGFSAYADADTVTEISDIPGVSGVYESLTYSACSEDEALEAASYDKISYADEVYRGEGGAVAVIDLSFDVNSKIFYLDEGAEVKYTEEDIMAKLDSGMNVSNHFAYFDKESPYVSSKIPFAYDYNDRDAELYSTNPHGTHVAGIIGANSKGDAEGGFDGVAPMAQLVLMKAGDDQSGEISDFAIMAALDDAVTLGVDVINMSFGVTAGFSSTHLTQLDYTVYLDRARAKGIDVVCAAGNDGRLGVKSRYSEKYGIDAPLASMPDYGLMNEPATYDNVIAVGSASSRYTAAENYIKLSDGSVIFYNAAPGSTFDEDFGGASLRYVMIPGTGAVEDFDGLYVSGKIAVIKRGVITFAEKIRNAQAKGALGVIIYNDDANETDLVNMLTDDNAIPSVFVSSKAGELLLRSFGRGDSLSVHCGELTVVDTGEETGMSAFSSWGVSPDLELKPDVTAIGSSVWSALTDGKYGLLSGTSMATPYISGELLILKQYLAEKGLDDIAYQLAVSSAKPMISKNGCEYSPRWQGAGLADIEAALNAEIIAYSTYTGECKIALGELDAGKRARMSVTVRNITDKDVTYTLSASCAGDEYIYSQKIGEYYLTDMPRAFKEASVRIEGSGTELNRYSDKFNGGVAVTVPASGYVELELTVIPGDDKKYEDIFKSGFFREGFITLTSQNGERSATIPYMGFVGDWGAVSVFGEGAAEDFYSRYLGSTLENGLDISLGDNIFTPDDNGENIPYASISPNKDGNADTLSVLLNPLRNILKYEIVIRDFEGEEVFSYSNSLNTKLQKAYYSRTLAAIRSKYSVNFWDGADFNNSDYNLPDGRYTLTVYAYPDYDTSKPSEYTFNFLIDTAKPEIISCSSHQSGVDYAVRVKARDDNAIQAIRFYTADGEYSEMITFSGGSADGEVIANAITDGVKAGEEIYFDIYDYAFNITVGRVIAGEK